MEIIFKTIGDDYFQQMLLRSKKGTAKSQNQKSLGIQFIYELKKKSIFNSQFFKIYFLVTGIQFFGTISINPTKQIFFSLFKLNFPLV